jgi:hypothetical protein
VKKKVLFEDTVNYYNKWVQGLATREFNAQRLKFKDLFNSTPDTTTQSPNNAKAGNTLPYPLPNIVPILGDLTTNTSNAIRDFKIALQSPVVKKNVKAQKEIADIISCLEKSQQELSRIFKIVSTDP